MQVARESGGLPAGTTTALGARAEPPSDALQAGAGTAQLYAWTGLALLNQLVIATVSPPADPNVRLWHHMYDFAQLSLLGWLSFGGVALARRVFDKLHVSSSRWPAALALGAVSAGVSLWMVDDDVANLAARYEIPIGAVAAVASLGFGAVLGATTCLRGLRARSLRALLLAAGAGAWLFNALFLRGDYWAVHWNLGWFSALLVGHGLEGVAPRWSPGRASWALGTAWVALGLLAVAIAPRPSVSRRLYSTSSSIVAPIAAQLQPDRKGPDIARVPRELLASPWFQDRRSLPPVEPTRALQPARPRMVLLLVIDSVRADVLAVRKHRSQLPVLAELSNSSAYFSAARAPASSTAASMASVFTGRYFSELYWSGRARLDEDPTPRVAELLRRAGVHGVTLHGLRRLSVASGIGRGFSEEVQRKRRASELMNEIIDVLEEAEGPLFLYAHFIEPHAPYQGKGPPFRRYLQEIRRVDKQLGRLFDFLSKEGLEQNTVVIITSDHGEAFGEHGMNYHARLVYEEVLRVPLLIRGPGVVAREIETPVSLIDLGPTILDLFHLPTPGVFKGQSLVPLLAGRSHVLDRPLASEASRGLQALRLPSGMKVIRDVRGRTVEVYDLVRDPGEREDLSERGEARIAAAVETTRLFFEVHRVKRPGYKPPRPF